MIMGLVVCLMVGWWWFNDLDALLCGAWRSAHHMSPYAEAKTCPGGQPADYMYLPQLAWMLSPIAKGPNISGLRWVFGLADLVIVAGLIYVLFLRAMEGAPRNLRAPILALTSGTAIASANIAFGCHAVVLAAVLLLRRRRAWPLILAIVAVSVIKPIFLTYLLIFAYEPERLAVRASRIAMGVALAVVAAALVVATGGQQLEDWRAGLTEVALGQQLGFGLLSWTAEFDLKATDRVTQLIYVAFAGLVCLAGLAIVEIRKLSPRARTLLALGIAQILNPRLMVYDFVMLAPLAVAFNAVPDAWRKTFQYALIAIGALAALVQVLRVYELIHIAPALLTLLLLASAGLALRDVLPDRRLAGKQ
jgi:hypothetical protein